METQAKTVRGISLIRSRMRRKAARMQGKTDYSLAESRVLMYLMENRDQEVCQKDIEEELGIRAATVTQMLQKMENKGLLIRSASRKDGRRKNIMLSDEMDAKRPEVQKQLRELEEIACRNVRPRDLDTFYRVLAQMIVNFDEEEKKDEALQRMCK